MFDRSFCRLKYMFDSEQVWIESWGPNALRVRATKHAQMPEHSDWALGVNEGPERPEIEVKDHQATISNGNLRAIMTATGKITMYNKVTNTVVLQEYVRNRRDVKDPACSALMVEAREFKPITGGPYRLTARFESLDKDERIYGMGQYQQPILNLKGQDLELAHRNSQSSVPFAVSSSGYGFLWNNPAIGRAVFGTNVTSFEAYSTDLLDYWVVVGDCPAAILEAYTGVTGRVPVMPEYGLGLWQSKLRYQNEREVMKVAAEHKRRGLPLDVIVLDFFHWPRQGEWKFDPTHWPDPKTMAMRLKEMNIELMVSVWPTIEQESENFQTMLASGFLVRADRGIRTTLDFQAPTIHVDTTNPAARKYLWSIISRHYHDLGIRLFWLDEAEPEYTVYDFDNYRYYLGPSLQVGNLYPVTYARTFYEGMRDAGQRNIVNLVRCGWAGSQKYGALLWSGDIASSWESLRNQLCAGLNMGLAGIPWWTTDIGGFHGGNPDELHFRELFVRWFQWATFCPVMRMHGDREPQNPSDNTPVPSGADNEVWSYGEEVFAICRRFLAIREKLRPYLRMVMQLASESGSPIIRPCFYDFPDDPPCWRVEEQYMFGPNFLVAPILYPGQNRVSVYFPIGAYWIPHGITDPDFETPIEGGQTLVFNCSLRELRVFERANDPAGTPNRQTDTLPFFPDFFDMGP